MRNVSPLDESIKLPFANALFPLGLGTGSSHRRLFKVQESLIRECVAKSNCLIVGRCADYILKDRDDVLNIFVYAPDDDRIEAVMKDHKFNRKQAQAYIEHRDHMLHSRYKYMTGTYRGDRHNRHMLIDSSVLGWRGTAQFIESLIRQRFGDI